MNIRMKGAEEWVSDLDDRIMQITQSGQQTESQIEKKYESNIRDLWDNIKCANLYIIGIPEGEEKRVLKMYLKKLWLKISNLKKTYWDTGGTEGPQQNEPKETFTKTQYSKNGKS